MQEKNINHHTNNLFLKISPFRAPNNSIILIYSKSDRGGKQTEARGCDQEALEGCRENGLELQYADLGSVVDGDVLDLSLLDGYGLPQHVAWVEDAQAVGGVLERDSGYGLCGVDLD